MGGSGEWVAQAVEVVCAAMLSLSRQSSNMITHLQLNCGFYIYMERGSVHLSHLLRSTHCNLLSLQLEHFQDGVPIEVEGGGSQLTTVGHIAQALQVNTTVTMVGIRGCTFCTSTVREMVTTFSKNGTLQVLAFNRVGFEKVEDEEDVARGLGQIISRNQSLHTFKWDDVLWKKTGLWPKLILPALWANCTLVNISLRACKAVQGDEVFQSLIRLVRTNTTIQHLDLSGTPLEAEGRVATILEELQLTREFRNTLSVLPTSTPKTARIILCGREYAGKSTLLLSIQQLVRGRTAHLLKRAVHKCKQITKLQSPLDKRLSERTRGVDIHSLDEIAGLRIHVWDLAGHREFHALYDFMLSNSRNASTLFVFTYSPIISPFEVGAGGLKPRHRLKEELRYWLQFLASKSDPTIKPQVMVVITNKDRVQTHFKGVSTGYRDWKLGLEETIATVAQKEFSDFIDLHPETLIVNVRGGSMKDLAQVEQWMDVNVNALKEASASLQKVPKVCNDVGRVLSRSQMCPIITKQEFFNICATQLLRKREMFLRKTKMFTPQASIFSEKVKLQLEAVAAAMHHSGEIIYDKDLRFIVTNPRWFGFGILGHLLDLFAQDVDAGRTAHLPKYGFITRKGLHDLLQEAAQSVPGLDQHHLSSDLLVDDLIKLMIRLHLCYEGKPNDPDNTGYFIPATFDDKDQKATNGTRSWEWVLPKEGAADTFIGKRLQCARPEQTFLTDGFFPRVQVMLYYLCINEKWINNSEDTSILTLEKNFFRICVDAMEIVVEFSGHCAYFIDIMVKSSHKSHREMNNFVDRHFLGAIRRLCASQQGCQGVALQEAVIRPACLQRRTPVVCAYRKNQAIGIQRLKELVDRDPGYRHQWGEVKDEGGRVIVHMGSDLGSLLLHGDTSSPTQGPSPPAQDLGSPRHIYVTEADVHWTRKLVAKARRGRVVPFRFHLQCECKDQEHVVDGQEGRMFYVVDNKFDSEESVRVAAAKGAAALLKGANSLAPGVGALASLPLCDGTPVYFDTIESLSGGSSQFRRPDATISDEELRAQVERDMQNSRAGPWMHAFLSFGPGLKEIEKFQEDFLVKEVEYLASSSSHTRAWLCEQHCRDGVDQEILRRII